MAGEGDPLLRMFLEQWRRDQADGVTLRSVHNRVSGIQREFQDFSSKTNERLKGLETRNEVEAEIGTGRFRALTTPVQPIPAPFPPDYVPAPPALPTRTEGKSSFFRTVKKSALKHGGTALGAALITLVVSWLAGHGCKAAQSVETPAAGAEKPPPATSEPPIVPLPFEPPTRPAVPRVMDASK